MGLGKLPGADHGLINQATDGAMTLAGGTRQAAGTPQPCGNDNFRKLRSAHQIRAVEVLRTERARRGHADGRKCGLRRWNWKRGLRVQQAAASSENGSDVHSRIVKSGKQRSCHAVRIEQPHSRDIHTPGVVLGGSVLTGTQIVLAQGSCSNGQRARIGRVFYQTVRAGPPKALQE